MNSSIFEKIREMTYLGLFFINHTLREANQSDPIGTPQYRKKDWVRDLMKKYSVKFGVETFGLPKFSIDVKEKSQPPQPAEESWDFDGELKKILGWLETRAFEERTEIAVVGINPDRETFTLYEGKIFMQPDGGAFICGIYFKKEEVRKIVNGEEELEEEIKNALKKLFLFSRLWVFIQPQSLYP